jgi:hypothetical protein
MVVIGLNLIPSFVNERDEKTKGEAREELRPLKC